MGPVRTFERRNDAVFSVLAVVISVAMVILLVGIVYVVLFSGFHIPDAAPAMILEKKDTYYENCLTVTTSDAGLVWEDVSIASSAGLISVPDGGSVEAGDSIAVPIQQGTVTITYVPTNTLIGKYDFSGPENVSVVRWNESSFDQQVFGIDLMQTCDNENQNMIWQIGFEGVENHLSTGVWLVIADGDGFVFALGWDPDESTSNPVYRQFVGSSWGDASTTLPSGMFVSGEYNQQCYTIVVPMSDLGGVDAVFYWGLEAQAAWLGHMSGEQQRFPSDWVVSSTANMFEDST